MSAMKMSMLVTGARAGALTGACLAFSGCGAREFLGSGRHNGTLFLGTFAASAIAAFLFALVRRRSQLGRWELGAAPAAPLAVAVLHPLFWAAGGALLLFVVADLTLVQHGGQKALNLLLFTAGGVIGGFLGGVVGVRLAERRWR